MTAVAGSGQPGRLVLLGHPVQHSLSPLIQNAALRAAGVDLEYRALDVPRSALDETLMELRRARAAGNVTIPHKEAVRSACDRVTAEARATGATNTFWVAVDGALVGDNTDVQGFQAAARALLGTVREGERIGLLGAGGAAAAVLHAMERWPGARVRVYTRTRSRAERLADRFAVVGDVCDTAGEAIRDATLVVNATPIGMTDDSLPVPVEALSPDSAVLDLVYRPGGTAFVNAARARGHVAADGMTMLIEQGAAAFERWFGRAPDRGAMWAAIAARR